MADSDEDFFIGYRASMPKALGSALRKRVVLIGMGVVALAAILPLLQKHFYPVVFEFGTVREFVGVLHENPVPTLAVIRPGQSTGVSTVSHYLLVGPGKFGATALIEGFHGRRVQLSGSLIHFEGQTMIEVVPDSVSVLEETEQGPSVLLSLGRQKLQGEIVDSKCYLGVMNPGNFKTHKACAIRCIAGGVPPLLVTRHTDGSASHYILLDEKGGSVNDRVLEMIAEPLEIKGEVFQQGNQRILKADPASFTVLRGRS